MYRLDAAFEGEILQLTGKLPHRDLRDRAPQIAPIAELLRRYPQFELNILGYGHNSETNPGDLARQRAQAVQTPLEDQGIDRRRLSAIASTDLPPNITADQDRWLARCVVFELIDNSPSTP